MCYDPVRVVDFILVKNSSSKNGGFIFFIKTELR